MRPLVRNGLNRISVRNILCAYYCGHTEYYCGHTINDSSEQNIFIDVRSSEAFHYILGFHC